MDTSSSSFFSQRLIPEYGSLILSGDLVDRFRQMFQILCFFLSGSAAFSVIEFFLKISVIRHCIILIILMREKGNSGFVYDVSCLRVTDQTYQCRISLHSGKLPICLEILLIHIDFHRLLIVSVPLRNTVPEKQSLPGSLHRYNPCHPRKRSIYLHCHLSDDRSL